MANKIVLDVVLRPKPLQDDLLVYDVNKKCFVEMTKSNFLFDTTQEIEKLKLENQALRSEISKFREQMSKMATIIKERVI